MVKGFQEEFDDASDSPASSRETVKVFLAVAANEGWKVECSDIRSAFLQSDTIIIYSLLIFCIAQKYKRLQVSISM